MRSTRGTPIEKAEYRVSTILLMFFEWVKEGRARGRLEEKEEVEADGEVELARFGVRTARRVVEIRNFRQIRSLRKHSRYLLSRMIARRCRISPSI